MNREESQESEPSVRIHAHESEEVASDGEASDVPTRCPVIGSGLKEDDEREDDYTNGDTSERVVLKTVHATNGQMGIDADLAVACGDIIASEPSSVENRKSSDPVTDGDGKDDESGTSSTDLPSIYGSMVAALTQQDVTDSQCCKKDLEDEQKRLPISQSFEDDSLSLHDRDPNYATQRPDTLGAINLVAQNSGNSGAIAASSGKVFQNGGAKSRTWRRGSGKGDASEDMIFEMAKLGRRTRGAGMDQLELNQHHLPVGSDDGSDSGDAAELESAQCESTEADQYKMNPEADQSESVRPDYAQAPLDIIGQTVRNSTRACSLMRGGRNLIQSADRYLVEDDVDDEEIHDASEITENEDLEWERLHDSDLADRAEDDHQYIVDTNDDPVMVAGGAKASQPGLRVIGKDSNGAVGGTSLHNALLRQHPNSAFSLLKPDGSGLYGEVSQPVVNSNSLANADRRSAQNGKDKTTNAVVPLQDQPVTKPTALFKPILHEMKTTCGNEGLHRSHFPRQNSEGSTSEGISGFRFGSIAKHGKTLSDNGLRSQPDKDDSVVHSPHLLTLNPSFEGGSSESLHSYLPSREDHLMIGEPDLRHLARSSIANDYQQQHAGQLGCNYQSMATPPHKHTRSSYHLMNDSLELSPIQPPSSHALHQQHYQHQVLSFIHSPGHASVGDTYQATVAGESNSRAHSFGGYKTSSEPGSEIGDIQEVRARLHGLLTVSDCAMPGKAYYDQINDTELLTGHPPSAWDLTGLHEALPLSSKYLLSGTSQATLDVAVLSAENRTLRKAVEQQRFKRKHCEQQIQQLQNKILELQENLTVAVSIDRRKDMTIEQLDKALVKVAESWHQKESECHETMNFLRQENTCLRQTLDSQRQLASRLEMQIKHSLQQLQLEQQRASQMFLSKDQHISELTSQCQRLQLMLDGERERWQQKFNDELKETEKLKEKMEFQLEELRLANLEDAKNWTEKEEKTLLQIEKIKEAHSKIMDIEKAKLEHQERSYCDLEMVLRATQTEVERLQLESEAIMREKESLKVEMGLMEARHLSDLHQLETELQSSADKKLSTKLDELSCKQMETEQRLHDTHRLRLQELSQRHLEELEQLKDEHNSVMCDVEESYNQQQKTKESRIQELEKKVKSLVEEKEKIEIHKLELSDQLRSMMQSHCEEALRLLHLTHLPSNPTDCSVSSNHQLHEPCGLSKEMNQRQEHNLCSQVFQSNGLQREYGDDAHDYVPCADGLPESVCSKMGEHGEHDTATLLNTSPYESSAQYTQFLASIRSYQPLLANLNASVTSVANSVSTLGQTSQQVHLENATKSEPLRSTIPHVVPLHHVSLPKDPVTSPLQQSTDSSRLANNVHLPLNNGDPHQQIQQGSELVNQRPRVSFEEHVDQPRPINCSTDSTVMFASSRHAEGEKNGSFSDNRGASLLTQILLHDSSNVSEESVMEGIENHLENNDADVDRLCQQEHRQQQLHHYIRLLLQRSPRSNADNEQSSDDKLCHHSNVPIGRPSAQVVDVDKGPKRTDNWQPQASAHMSSAEQDFQIHPTKRDRNSVEGSLGGANDCRRSITKEQEKTVCQSNDAKYSSTSQTGYVLSQQHILEMCRLLDHKKLVEVPASVQTPSSSLSSQPPVTPLPVTELLGYLKTTYGEQIFQSNMDQGEQTCHPSEATDPLTDANTKEGSLPRNHPDHQVIKDIAFGNGLENAPIKQEPLKYNKSNKTESSKPKNTASASRQSDRKEKSSVPRNSNKQAAWK